MSAPDPGGAVAAPAPAASPPGRRPPALGLRIWGVLFRDEWFKARKRLAFWLAFGFFTLITFAMHGEGFFERDPDFALPAVWSNVFSDDAVLLFFFACISIILLTASEFSWRTARQNVIDGLSKTQWFWGKAFILPIVALAFLGTYVLLPGILAALRTDFGALAEPAVPGAALQAVGGVLLALFSTGSLALFLALAIRNAGGAMAVWFLWIVPGEQLIITGLVSRFLPGLQDLLAYLPFNAAVRMLEYRAYDPALQARLAEAARAAERSAPPPIDTATFALVNAGWGLLFVLAAFLWFRRRDL